MVRSATNLYSPGLVGEYAHNPPSRSVPGMSVQALPALALLCHFELWTVYVTPLIVVLPSVMQPPALKNENCTLPSDTLNPASGV